MNLNHDSILSRTGSTSAFECYSCDSAVSGSQCTEWAPLVSNLQTSGECEGSCRKYVQGTTSGPSKWKGSKLNHIISYTANRNFNFLKAIFFLSFCRVYQSVMFAAAQAERLHSHWLHWGNASATAICVTGLPVFRQWPPLWQSAFLSSLPYLTSEADIFYNLSIKRVTLFMRIVGSDIRNLNIKSNTAS